jgi:hypothetical protein
VTTDERGPPPTVVPGYVVAMVRRAAPENANIVVGSTPVVAFGDPSAVEVATLGINPSASEFRSHGQLLSGNDRRLATLESLGAERLDDLTDSQVAELVSECAAYFRRRPYRRWFDPLDKLLKVGANVSYYDGTACHLDLVQWATDPIWGEIPDSKVRDTLLEDGLPHLRAQLARENIRLVLLNGRAVMTQVGNDLAKLDKVHELRFGRANRCELYLGTGLGIRWIGWSTNLQSSWGVDADFKQELAEWIAENGVNQQAEEPPVLTPPASSVRNTAKYPPRGLRLAGKRALVDVLVRWLRDSSAETLGDVGAFGGKPWLTIQVHDHIVALNADTKRAAIEAFVSAAAVEPDRPWRVVPNQNSGRVNKVLPGPEARRLPGWYAYVTPPLGAEGTI